MRTSILLVVCAVLFPLAARADEANNKEKAANSKIKEVAGVAEFLRSVPKHFATLQAVDAARRRVTLLVEGDQLAKTWELASDAEVKIFGWSKRKGDILECHHLKP